MSLESKPELVYLNAPERSRTYFYANGFKFTVNNVIAVGVRPSGNHRIETGDGKKYIIQPG